MGPTPQRNLFISTLAFRQPYRFEQEQDEGEDPAALLTSRSRDAVTRSRALLARTSKLLGMKDYGKPTQK